MMAVVVVRLTEHFARWTCPCGRSFYYPDQRFPSAAANEHFATDCPLDEERPGLNGRYEHALAFWIQMPAAVWNSMDNVDARWFKPRVR